MVVKLPARQYYLAMQQGRSSESNKELQRGRNVESGVKRHRREHGRPWPVKALTLLLLTQGVGLVLLGVFRFDAPIDWTLISENYFFALLPPLGIIALLAALGFLTLRPGAWVVAMLVQGLTLLLSIVFYFHRQPANFVLYGLMLFSIVMVLYLNYADVPKIFRVEQDRVEPIGAERRR